MTFAIQAPCTGKLVPLEEVPDPVFNNKLVGPGIAIDPERSGEITVVAPVAGKIMKLHPHAFVIASEQGKAVLVHLGLDTVTLGGEGFTLVAAEGQSVVAGDAILKWNPAQIETEKHLNPVVPVIAMETEEAKLRICAQEQVAAGELLLEITD